MCLEVDPNAKLLVVLHIMLKLSFMISQSWGVIFYEQMNIRAVPTTGVGGGLGPKTASNSKGWPRQLLEPTKPGQPSSKMSPSSSLGFLTSAITLATKK